MQAPAFRTLDHDVRTPRPADWSAFCSRMGGAVLTAADTEYDEARHVWNATVDRRPAAIARCSSESDIRAAVRFAGEHRLLTSVRGGGHHIAGNAVADQGLMIDLSGMRSVRVDAARRTAVAAPGALLADVDAATQAHGLATPLGVNSTTGVAGLTLGGGFGWLTRSRGMTIDNLIGATVVTADGASRAVSATAEPELFWAIRGGGGNFGVVSSFEFRLHPVGPEVYAGLIVYPFRDARSVLRAWRDFTATASEELTVWALMRKAPPLPFLPESVHGSDILVLAVVYVGNVEQGERQTAPLLQFGTPIATHLGAAPFAGFQRTFDPLLVPGRRNYWKSHNFAALSDAALDVIAASAEHLPGPECEIFVAHLGGAMSRVAPGATAYAARQASYVMNVHGRWADPADDERVRSWARQTFHSTAAYADGGGYVNFLTEDEAGRVAASYGSNYERLQKAKRRFDPDNLFRLNLNIVPAGEGTRAAAPGRAASGGGVPAVAATPERRE